MLLTSTELSRQPPTKAWFCLRAQPKREHIAAACLRQTCEVEVFCPRLRFRQLTSRGPVWFIEAMFPGYLFARFDYANCHRRGTHWPLTCRVACTTGGQYICPWPRSPKTT